MGNAGASDKGAPESKSRPRVVPNTNLAPEGISEKSLARSTNHAVPKTIDFELALEMYGAEHR